MSITLINPMNETRVESSAPPARLKTLAGANIALLDIGKTGGSVFLDRLEQLLKDRYQVGSVLRLSKPTFARPAPSSIVDQLRSSDAVIEALAD